MRRTWFTINEALNKIKKQDAFPNYIMVDGIKTDSKTGIANSFNSFFANIGKNLSEKYIALPIIQLIRIWNRT